MKIADIIKPTKESGFILRSGAQSYDKAVVISIDPFVITSEEADMRWEATIKMEDFEVIGKADRATLNKCLRRI